MNKKDEALKLALRSLRELVPDDSDYAPALQGQRMRQEKAIKATQEALKKDVPEIGFGNMAAQQEPVAVVSGYYGGQCVILPIDPARIFNPNTALYTSPPAQRTWVWLSNEEEKQIKDNCTTVACVLKSVKAKLKEKNT